MAKASERLPRPRVFISHSTKDQAFVEHLATDLQESGVDTWYSGWDIRPGDLFPEKINQGLEWCEFFIVVLSRLSLSRPWVQTELYAALFRQNNGNIRMIIPVKIEEYGSVPAIFAPLHVEDLSDSHYTRGLSRLLDSVLGLAGNREIAPSAGDNQKALSFSLEHSTQTRTSTWAQFLALALIILFGSSVFAQTTNQRLVSVAVVQFGVGLSLAAIVWVFFERVDNLMKRSTKFEIAGWLLGLNVSDKIAPWPDMFFNIFRRVFGPEAFSFRCVLSSAIASYSLAIIVILLSLAKGPMNPHKEISVISDVSPTLLVIALFTNIVPDYLALLVTRGILVIMRKSRNGLIWFFLLIIDLAATATIALALWGVMFSLTFNIWANYYDVAPEMSPIARPEALLAEPVEIMLATLLDYSLYLWLCPVFFTSIWLWLYAGSGYLLKLARRVQIGFDWFTIIFDVEKQPLSAIGLVAGALVAIVYWTTVLLSRIVV
ncbi:MAG: toll/interleukin-1 receptor domain-containing protein [Deltaproteobacteria bacterium]|nr:toll/interleukin-1 receptor domain-containing protein [Deltaproteobacteria bacterium]